MEYAFLDNDPSDLDATPLDWLMRDPKSYLHALAPECLGNFIDMRHDGWLLYVFNLSLGLVPGLVTGFLKIRSLRISGSQLDAGSGKIGGKYLRYRAAYVGNIATSVRIIILLLLGFAVAVAATNTNYYGVVFVSIRFYIVALLIWKGVSWGRLLAFYISWRRLEWSGVQYQDVNGQLYRVILRHLDGTVLTDTTTREARIKQEHRWLEERGKLLWETLKQTKSLPRWIGELKAYRRDYSVYRENFQYIPVARVLDAPNKPVRRDDVIAEKKQGRSGFSVPT